MKIVLSGVETNNKGAELMLYAILQEIEQKWPDADVYLPYFAVRQGLDYIKSSLKLHYCPAGKMQSYFRYVIAAFRRLHITPLSFYETFNVGGADYFLDASGFCFSDQLPMNDLVMRIWERTLSKQSQQGSKVIFLPQAYGPAEKEGTKKILRIVSMYSDLLMVREHTSREYLLKSEVVDMNKVRLFPDFTINVHGVIPKRYEHLSQHVCIIPNNRMLEKGVLSFYDYLETIKEIVNCVGRNKRKCFLLCHEEKSDTEIVKKIKDALSDSIETVTGLNALEVKGVISQSYLCISSRFHGVISSLNSCVPCLSTSWSHKYSELYKDYGLEDCVVDFARRNECISRIEEFLTPEKNESVKRKISLAIPKLEETTKQMWKSVWEL